MAATPTTTMLVATAVAVTTTAPPVRVVVEQHGTSGFGGLLGVLVGAALAIAIQWVVTPRVQRRMRAQERWESDVLQAGQLLSDEIPRARERARSVWLSFDVLREVSKNPDYQLSPDKIAAEEKRLRDAAHEPFDKYRELVDVRLRWLMSRISTRSSKDINGAEVRWLHYSVTAIARPWMAFDESCTEDTWSREDESRKRLLAAITTLADSIRPYQQTRLSRAREGVRKWRKRLSDRQRK